MREGRLALLDTIASGESVAVRARILRIRTMIAHRRFRPLMLHPWACLAFRTLLAVAQAADPPRYVPATAYYILPETTSEESGYFSLSESLDGLIHVGSAKY